MRGKLLAAVLSLWVAAGAALAQTEQRVALVVGNGNYASVGKLKNPANDATAVAALLRRLGFDVIERENVPRRAMIQAARTFADKLSPGGIGLFFYAGHGVQAQGINYLVPVDAALAVEDDLKYETIDLQDILNKLDDARVRLSIVILDACRDNPFRPFRSNASGLATINPPNGTVVVYATAPGKVAADGDGDHSIFTTELLRAMSEPDKLLSVFERVTDAVERKTGNLQTPWINSSFRGDFYFNGPTTVNIAPPPDPTNGAGSAEIIFWQSIADSTNPADFDAYLKQFPQGNFVALARVRLEALVSGRAHAPLPPVQGLKSPDATNQKTPSGSAQKQKASITSPTPKVPPPSGDDIARLAVTPSFRIDKECDMPNFHGVYSPGGALAALRVVNNGKRCGGHIWQNDLSLPLSLRVPAANLSLTNRPMHGTVTIDGNGFFYTPLPGFVGNDNFVIVTSPPGRFATVVTVLPPEALRSGTPSPMGTQPAPAATTSTNDAVANGSEALQRKDYAGAMRWFREAADQGNASAQSNIGRIYLYGWGVTRDYAEALRWFRDAARQNDPVAQSSIGRFYQNGWVVKQDYAEAMRWFRQAADQDNSDAKSFIGVFYIGGWGVQRDYTEAMRWLRKAADQGNNGALTNIGLLYQHGLGVKQDYAEAMRWYRMAADHGFTNAQLAVAQLYEVGLGADKDLAQARSWMEKAAAGGNTTAKQWLSAH